MNAILVYSNDIDILIESVALASLSSYEDQSYLLSRHWSTLIENRLLDTDELLTARLVSGRRAAFYCTNM